MCLAETEKGGTSDEDEACAIEGIRASGLEYKV